MKKIVLSFIVLLVIVSSLSAGFSPSAHLSFGTEIKETLPSIKSGVTLSIISWKFNPITLSLPLRGESVTHSLPENGTEIPKHFRVSSGIEIEYETKHLEAFLSLLVGIIDYTEIFSLQRDITIEGGVGWRITPYISLRLPLSIAFSNTGITYSINLSLKVGGSI